jgi:hypothetical protein
MQVLRGNFIDKMPNFANGITWLNEQNQLNCGFSWYIFSAITA